MNSKHVKMTSRSRCIYRPSTPSSLKENRRMKRTILAVVSLALLSVLPYASAQQAGDDGIPTNLPGVKTALAPPDGFDPLAAWDDELATYGFPPRPDEDTSRPRPTPPGREP